MTAVNLAGVLDLILKLVVLVPGLTTIYFKIVDSLHKTGELSDAEWEARKADYEAAMQGAAWGVDP